MIAQDRLEKEKSDAKNSVEEYVYDMRDKVYSMYEEFVSEEVRNTSQTRPLTLLYCLYKTGEAGVVCPCVFFTRLC